jgi:hypothetical protein
MAIQLESGVSVCRSAMALLTAIPALCATVDVADERPFCKIFRASDVKTRAV